jgi:hypothetical protein
MTSFHGWDQEVIAIGSQIDQVARDYVGDGDRPQIAGLKLAIFQAQARLATLLEQLSGLNHRRDLLGPSARSFVHWVGVYSEKIQHFYLKQIHLLGKYMWLKLIAVRLSANQSSLDMGLADENLLEMSIRKNSLLDSERQLQQRLTELQNRKAALKSRYQNLSAELANQEAATSLQTEFATNFANVGDHPTLQKLKVYMKNISIGAHTGIASKSQITAVQESISSRTEAIMDRCRSLVLASEASKDPRHVVSNASEYEQSLLQIKHLQSQVLEVKSLLGQTPSDPHPILMKKSSFPYKTEVRRNSPNVH